MTKRVHKASDGKYHIKGKIYDMLVGSRAQVWHETAYKTSYGKDGLTKQDLMMNKNGRIVSRIKHTKGRKDIKNTLGSYVAKKGKFGPGNAAAPSRKRRRSSKRRRSGGRRTRRR